MLYKSTIAKSDNPFVLDPFSVDDMTALNELRASIDVHFHHESEDDSVTGWCNVYQSERELTQEEQTVLYLTKF